MGAHSFSYWQERLEEVWFGDRTESDPVVLFMDDDLLQSTFAFIDQPLEDLGQAVRAELANQNSIMFTSLERKVIAWRGEGCEAPPPILPLLAMTVIAASRMGTGADGPATMYYKRLAQLLGIEKRTDQLRSSFDQVVHMWTITHEWINSREWLGPSTISTFAHHSRIGYPRSQALVSRQDHLRLLDLFSAMGKQALHDIGDHRLLDEVRRWNERREKFSPGFQTALDSKETVRRDELTRIVRVASNNWGGAIRRRPRRTIEAELMFDTAAWSMEWAIPFDPNIKMFELQSEIRDGLLKGERGYSDEVLVAEGLPAVDQVSLLNKEAWSDEYLQVKISPRNVWIFSATENPDALLSQRSISQYDEVAVFIPHEESQTLNTRLLEYGAEFRRVPPSKEIIEGWDIFLGLVINTEALLYFMQKLIAPNQEQVQPGGSRPSLVSGLKINTESNIAYYLQGGEPELLVPATSGTYKLTLDGETSAELRANGTPLPLSGLDLVVGRHALKVSDQWNLSFTTIDPATVAVHISETVDGGAEDIPSRKLLIRRHRLHWFVQDDGSAVEVVPLPIPDWLSERGVVNNLLYCEIDVPRNAVWYIAGKPGLKPVIERVSQMRFHLNDEAIRASQNVWTSILECIPSNTGSAMDNLILVAKSVVK